MTKVKETHVALRIFIMQVLQKIIFLANKKDELAVYILASKGDMLYSYVVLIFNIRAVASSMIGGGGGADVHIFVFCRINFL